MFRVHGASCSSVVSPWTFLTNNQTVLSTARRPLSSHSSPLQVQSHSFRTASSLSKQRGHQILLQCQRNQFNFSKKGSGGGGGGSPLKKPFEGRRQTTKERSQTTMLYLYSLTVLTVGATYAAVPLYRMFCQSSGYAGTVQQVDHNSDKVERLVVNKERKLTVRFSADTAASMQWNFRPQQASVTLYPGETALAFYTAKNPTDKSIDGISTYNVLPFQAGQYFNKIQCFCFEEQRLNPGEEVDMPVFFYIDPDFAEDPFLENVNQIDLSYTFFESKPGMQQQQLPLQKRSGQ